MRQRVIRALRPLHAFAVENLVHPGTPDVAHVGGWIELKLIFSWPVLAHSIVRVRHFEPEQRIFLDRYVRAGGRADLLLQVGSEWLGLYGGVAASILGRVPRADLLAAAAIHWPTTPTDEALLRWINRPQARTMAEPSPS